MSKGCHGGKHTSNTAMEKLTQQNLDKRSQFLRQNPRFINEPICSVNFTIDGGATVAECMKWYNHDSRSQPAKIFKCSAMSLSSSSRQDYQQPSKIVKHFHKAPKTIIQSLLEPDLERSKSAKKEYISFKHQYNCRSDPNEPIKGKLHGSFVWELKKNNL